MSYALDRLIEFLQTQEADARKLIMEPNPHTLYNDELCTACIEFEAEADKFHAWRLAVEALREMAGK